MYERRHSLVIADFGGVATAAPWLATIFLITTLASIGLPMLNNFVGEFLVLQGAAQANFAWTAFAAIGVIFSACYMLWMYQRVFFGTLAEEVKHHMPELNLREWACIVPLIVMMVWMGMYTQTFLPAVSETNARILDQSRIGDITQIQAARSWREVTSMPVNFAPSVDRPAAVRAGDDLDHRGYAADGARSALCAEISALVRASFDAALIAAIFAAIAANRCPALHFPICWWSMVSARIFRVLVLCIGILAVLASYRYLDREKAETGEYHALILFSIMGQCVMVTANDLIMIFIGLEISSIATYVLAGYLRNDKRNNEVGSQVFPAGIFRHWFPALRHRDDLWR